MYVEEYKNNDKWNFEKKMSYRTKIMINECKECHIALSILVIVS